MTTDIHPSTMGPHALALLQARTKALKAYGIAPHALQVNQETRLPMNKEEKIQSLAKTSNANRAIAVASEHGLLA